MARVVLLSDLHLSPTHGFFWPNWICARDLANAANADLVIINGDLAINAADSDAEMALTGRALSKLTAPWHALPGNHDVGDEPPGQDAHQIINETRLARWRAVFGADRFAVTLEGWRLLGLNAQLLGSGLPAEADQTAWLAAELAAAPSGRVVLFLHKPLFMENPDEAENTTSCITPAPRAALLKLLHEHGVTWVISGHLHAWRDRVIDGIRYIWLPATSFTGQTRAGGEAIVGIATLNLTESSAELELSRPAGLTPFDLVVLKEHGRYAFLRDMPPCPPDETD